MKDDGRVERDARGSEFPHSFKRLDEVLMPFVTDANNSRSESGGRLHEVLMPLGRRAL
jgi:hypothetical protein